MNRIRIFGWVIIAFNVWYLFQMAKNASELAGDDLATGAYLILAVLFWALLNVILYVLYRVTSKGRGRECPACGSKVKVGVTSCMKCGFDFMKAASGSSE